MNGENERTRRGLSARTCVYMAAGAALLALGAWITVPMVVPFSMQTFVLFLLIGTVGAAVSAGAVTLYLLLGAAGVPVFAAFGAGVGVLFGPTGGFLFGFLLVCGLCRAAEAIAAKSARPQAVLLGGMIAGMLLCYVCGAVWLGAVYAARGQSASAWRVICLSVLPFLLPDAVKIALAWVVAKKLRRWVR